MPRLRLQTHILQQCTVTQALAVQVVCAPETRCSRTSWRLAAGDVGVVHVLARQQAGATWAAPCLRAVNEENALGARCLARAVRALCLRRPRTMETTKLRSSSPSSPSRPCRLGMYCLEVDFSI